MDPHRLESVLAGRDVELHDECKATNMSRAQQFINTESISSKRRLEDDGEWWLPVDTP